MTTTRMAKAAVIIIKFRPGEVNYTSQHHAVGGKVVANWTVDNIVAYSKICTHVGCPAALYEQTTHHILCPCHQSTFVATEGARVIFGPATRPLPQLPIGVDSSGLPHRHRPLPRAGGPELLGAVMSVDRALGGTGTWLDDRLHGARGVRVLLRKIFPDHWSFLLGEIILYSFIILLLTGTFLTLWFQPSMTDVIYHGSYTPLHGVRMSEAYASTLHISFDVRGGLLIRQIHHWAADLFMAGIMAHMIRVFFTGAYRKPREINWLIGIILFTLGLLEGLFGYSLPDDLLSGAGLRILEGVIQSLPIVGTYLAFFLFGGPFPGNQIIPRLYILHVLLIPGLILALVTVHLFLMFHQKHTQMPGKGRTNENVVGAPMYPYFMAKTGAFFFFVFAALRPGRDVRADQPDLAVRAVQPGRHVGRLAARLLHGHARRRAAHHACLAVGAVGAYVRLQRVHPGPGAARPYLQRRRRSGRSSSSGSPATGASTTSTTGRATRRPGPRSASGSSPSTASCGLRAPTTSSPTTSTSRCTGPPWAARVGIFVGPVIAYIITKRICLGLQRKDNHLVEHGVETGNIRQLPGGEFIEETRPVDDERLAVLTSRVEHPPLPPGETAETDVPAPGMRGGLGRVRERLYKVVTESTPIPSSHGTATGTAMATATRSRPETATSTPRSARAPDRTPVPTTRARSTSAGQPAAAVSAAAGGRSAAARGRCSDAPGLKAELQRSLQAARQALLSRLDGLGEYDLRRPMTPTGTNLLGLVKHLADLEYIYLGASFGRTLAPWENSDPQAEMWAAAAESSESIIGLYQRACAHADLTISQLEVDAPGSVAHWADDDRQTTLGAMLIYMVWETAQHAGHADIIRELIDGTAGDDDGSSPTLAGRLMWPRSRRRRTPSGPLSAASCTD